MKVLFLRAIALLPVLFLVSCGHVMTKSESYTQGEAVSINGASVRSAVKPNGGKQGFSFSAMVYTAASVSLDGPFLWRIEADGKEGVHESMVVHQIRVTTSETKRSEWFPSKYLGESVPFKPKRGAKGESFAQFQLPGDLEVYPKKDGEITIEASISVKSNSRTERQNVSFSLNPESSRGVETLNVGGEIIKSFQGKDPTEWKLKPVELFPEEQGW